MKIGLVSPVDPLLTWIEVPPEPDGDGILKIEPETLVWKAAPPSGDGVAIYKMYRRRGPISWCRERCGRFRVQREHESLVHLARSRVPCAPPVTWGYGTHPAHGRFEVLITMEVPGAQTVESYLASHSQPDEVLLASGFAVLRRMHACGVYHGRLDPRNVLVVPPGAAGPGCHIIDTPQAIIFPGDIGGSHMARRDLMHFSRPFLHTYGAEFTRRMLAAYGLDESAISRAVARLPSYQKNRHWRNWYRFEFGVRAFAARIRARPSPGG